MTNLQLFVHLITTIIPTLGVLTYLLLHRRQAIRADIDELKMRQEHGLQRQMLDTERSKALSSLAQTFAPMLGQFLERAAASINKPPSIDDFGDEELLDELNRRVSRRYGYHVVSDHPASECCPGVEGDGPSWEPPAPPREPDEPESSLN